MNGERVYEQKVDLVSNEVRKSRRGRVLVQNEKDGADNSLNIEEFRMFFKMLLEMEEIETLFIK